MSKSRQAEFYKYLGQCSQILCEYPSLNLNLFEAYKCIRTALSQQRCFLLLDKLGEPIGLIVWQINRSSSENTAKNIYIEMLLAPSGAQLSLLEQWQQHFSINETDFEFLSSVTYENLSS